MNKRAQLTIFIVIAVIVIALALIAWQFWPRIRDAFMSEEQARAFLSTQVRPLKDSISFCIKETAKEILEEQGRHAGYYEGWHDLYYVEFANQSRVIVMYKDENKVRVNKLPSLEEIKKEFSKALEADGYEKIDRCLENFAKFKRKMQVIPGERKIDLEIEEDKVIVDVDWPITIKKGRASLSFNQENITLFIPLGKIWRVANDIVNFEVKQINFIDIQDSYNRNYASLKEGILIDAIAYPTNEQIIFMLRTDPNYYEEEYNFYFVVDRS